MSTEVFARGFAHALFCGLLFVMAAPVSAQSRAPEQAAVASAHPLATQAGIEILEAGGNAFDAAVAVTATLAVVEPYGSGIGGGGFYLLHQARDGRQIMLDARETAPADARQTHYLRQGELDRDLSLNSAYAAGIPGTPAALEHLAKHYGKLPLAQTLAPAIRHAREGFEANDRYRMLAGFRLEQLRTQPQAAAIFLKDNEVPPPGHRIVQSDLATTLEIIADQGAAGFYLGELGERLVRAVADVGGVWSRNDLVGYRVIEREPIVIRYRNMRMVSASPPSSGGIVAGQALQILEQFDLDRFDSVTRKHVIVEALRQAYRDRAAYLGDPDFIQIPVQRLLDHEYTAGLADKIQLDSATPSTSLGVDFHQSGLGGDTTHFSILDGEGNRVAATLSINYPFGTGIVAGDTGILLNNELDDFALKPRTPNVYGLIGDEANKLEPGKRPLSSMTPTFLETDDKIAILGTPGGSRIISMVLLAALEFYRGGLPRDWVAAARFHHQFLPDEIQHEPGALSAYEQAGLQYLGHTLKDIGRQYGDMQAILWHKPTNLVFAASDPRGEGSVEILQIREAGK